MNKFYTVIRTTHKKPVWAITEALMKTLTLNQDDRVTLQCGSAVARARVRVLPAGVKQMGLSPGILHALMIPDSPSLLVKPVGNKTFRLGPVIGVLTFHSHITGGKLGYYKTSAGLNINNGLLYVFSGRHINAEKCTISGYYYDHGTNEWKWRDFPFPDAVIDRCYPNVGVYHRLLEQVIGPGRIFNKKSCINKSDFYRALKADPLLRDYIPETSLFRKSSKLVSYLKKYDEVFLKPVNGMKGIGIVTVKSTPKGLLACRCMQDGKTVTQLVPDAGSIFDVLKKASGRNRPYIIQQAVTRMAYRGGPFSIRSWAMKNGHGRWVMPGMFAKGTFGDGFLTNFTAGAKLIPLKDLFDDIIPRLPYTKHRLMKVLEKLTLETAAALDKKFGPLGELGLDIVFDTAGKPWVIEANGNPGKIPIFIQKEYPLWRYLVYQYPLLYATHLAGFDKL